MELAKKKCVPCEGGMLPMNKEEAERYLQFLPGWSLINNSIEKEFKFKRYAEGLDYAIQVGRIAEEQNHHPDILIKYKKVNIILTTHAIGGLSENDFIMAAKYEELYSKMIGGSGQI